jgi:hypothetical protein
MLPDYPTLKRRLNEKFEDIIRNKVQNEPLLSQFRRTTIHEGNTLAITSSDGYSSKTNYQEFATDFKIGFDEIIKSGPEAFYSRASEISKDMASKLAKQSIGMLEKVTERTGNVVKSEKGEGITPKLILDAIEKMEIGFDEAGNPIMPVVVMSPKDFEKIKGKQKEWKSDGELEKRRKEIIEKKRKEWVDRESNRKLVD